MKCEMYKTVALPMNEAEFNKVVSYDHDMMYALRVIGLPELQVELPMILNIDNCGTVDLKNNWCVSVSTCHIETPQQ